MTARNALPRRFLLICHGRTGVPLVLGKYRTIDAAEQAREAYESRPPWTECLLTIDDALPAAQSGATGNRRG